MSARIRRAIHNTGCLPIEAVVTYPFHPFAGQIVPIVGHIEHAGTRHLIIRTGDESGFLLPAWMTAPEASLVRIVTCPRLPVNRVVELRAVIDRLMASSSGELVPTGGQGDKKISSTAESVRTNSTLQRSAVSSSFEGNRAAQGTVEGSDGRTRSRNRRPNKRGSWR